MRCGVHCCQRHRGDDDSGGCGPPVGNLLAVEFKSPRSFIRAPSPLSPPPTITMATARSPNDGLGDIHPSGGCRYRCTWEVSGWCVMWGSITWRWAWRHLTHVSPRPTDLVHVYYFVIVTASVIGQGGVAQWYDSGIGAECLAAGNLVTKYWFWGHRQ